MGNYIKFDKQKQEWVAAEADEPEAIWLDGFARKKLDLMKNLQKKGWDNPILVCGNRGVGKSVFTQTLAFYASDGELTIDCFIKGMEDAAHKLANVKEGGIVIFDEGSLNFGSRDTLLREQRALMKIIDTIRQKRLFIFIVAPSFFDLNRQLATYYAKCMFRCYTTSDFIRGKFCYYPHKKLRYLYSEGKSRKGDYNVVKPQFRGKFVDIHLPFYNEYLKVKEKSLKETLDAAMSSKTPYRTEKDIQKKYIVDYIIAHPDKRSREIAEIFGVSQRLIQMIIHEYHEMQHDGSNNTTTKDERKK